MVAGELDSYDGTATEFTITPPMASLHPDLIRLVSLGHEGLLHDFFQVWLNQVINDPRLTAEHADELATAVTLIARHRTPYDFVYIGSCFTLWELGRPDLCFRVSEAGLKANPASWKIPMTQGFIDAFILQVPTRAAFFYQLAASREHSPDYVARVAQRLLDQEEVTESDFLATLEEMLNKPGNESLRALLQRSFREPR